VLNDHFGGTYMAYLALESGEDKVEVNFFDLISELLEAQVKETEEASPAAKDVFEKIKIEIEKMRQSPGSKQELLNKLELFASSQADQAPDEQFDAWDEVLLFIDLEKQREQVFKNPKVLNYIEALQKNLLKTGVVGKSNSLSDVVKTVHRELFLGKEDQFRIPSSSNAVAQTLITYQNSHRPQDLWHFVTPDYRKTNLWIQLKSGDNMDMSRLVQDIDSFIAANPPPLPLKHQWFGLTYINVIWQDKMVSGMLKAFIGSFLVVLLMMTVLFRSALWGLLSMIPLTVTIGLIYGAIGLTGKDYDMPVAVLSSLSLGLAIDYAIHFLARSRKMREGYGSWFETIKPVFGEPARAISRNVVVIGAGFLPLLAAPLIPYQTVGIFIAAILLTAGVASLLILPSMVRLLEPWLFKKKGKNEPEIH
jgi:hypothetical protein